MTDIFNLPELTDEPNSFASGTFTQKNRKLIRG